MTVLIHGAREHNLQNIDIAIGDGLTVITGVSGSGKTSLAFNTLYHEARRRFLSRAERIAALEGYLNAQETEAQAVREKIEDVKGIAAKDEPAE